MQVDKNKKGGIDGIKESVRIIFLKINSKLTYFGVIFPYLLFIIGKIQEKNL